MLVVQRHSTLRLKARLEAQAARKAIPPPPPGPPPTGGRLFAAMLSQGIKT